MYFYQKGDYESMRKDTLEFAKEKYFNGQYREDMCNIFLLQLSCRLYIDSMKLIYD